MCCISRPRHRGSYEGMTRRRRPPRARRHEARRTIPKAKTLTQQAVGLGPTSFERDRPAAQADRWPAVPRSSAAGRRGHAVPKVARGVRAGLRKENPRAARPRSGRAPAPRAAPSTADPQAGTRPRARGHIRHRAPLNAGVPGADPVPAAECAPDQRTGTSRNRPERYRNSAAQCQGAMPRRGVVAKGSNKRKVGDKPRSCREMPLKWAMRATLLPKRTISRAGVVKFTPDARPDGQRPCRSSVLSARQSFEDLARGPHYPQWIFLRHVSDIRTCTPDRCVTSPFRRDLRRNPLSGFWKM
ncbi:hypothetical protein SHIRM173S_10442 [Streptomyces hirsutus]